MLNTPNPKSATIALVITLAACAEETPDDSTFSADRAALAEFGVADVEGFGDPFVLIDEDGDHIGRRSSPTSEGDPARGRKAIQPEGRVGCNDVVRWPSGSA